MPLLGVIDGTVSPEVDVGAVGGAGAGEVGGKVGITGGEESVLAGAIFVDVPLLGAGGVCSVEVDVGPIFHLGARDVKSFTRSEIDELVSISLRVAAETPRLRGITSNLLPGVNVSTVISTVIINSDEDGAGGRDD